jgi:uncharacterized membrane protein
VNISTRSIVVAGLLIAVSAVLAVTGLGYFPVPNVTAEATIMHVPAIIGGVLEGPVVGLLVGVVFGINALMRFSGLPIFAAAPVWAPFVVLFLPRLFIGVAAWYSYKWLRGWNEIGALAVAGVVGTLTNTVLVIGIGILLGLLPVAIIPTVIPQAAFESVVAAILTIAVVAAWKGIERGRAGSSV